MIETERLILRLPVPDDALAISEAITDAEVMRFIGAGETRTLDDAVEHVQWMLRAWSEDGFGPFIVVRKADGEPLGGIGLIAWDPSCWRIGIRAEIGEQAEIELGWTLSRRAWGFGYATEAAVAARDWALREIQPRRLISLIHPENTRSMRVANKIGESYEREITTHRGIPAQLWAFKLSPSTERE